MRYVPLRERPEFKEHLRRIANTCNVSKAFRAQVIADLTRQLDRIDESFRKRQAELAAAQKRGRVSPKPR